MKPVLKYPGAKWSLSKWIIDHLPEHESYLEPYFGSGAVFFNKEPARIETINDMDGEIVNFFKVCREQPEELARAINLTPWARQEVEKSCQKAEDPVERARRTAVCCHMIFGAKQRGKSFRHTTGKKKDGGPDHPKLWEGVPEIVLEAGKRLKNAQIENKPAVELIREYDGPEVLIYLDPPYVRDTRTLHGDQYRFEMSDQEHEELLGAIVDHSGKIILSGYDNDLYNDVLKGWEKHSTKSQTERGKVREETIWMNYQMYEQIAIFNL